MATGERYYAPYSVEVNANGVPIPLARLFFYISETSTPLDTYEDPDLTTPNTNPVVADANGRFPAIWLSATQGYKVELWTAATLLDPTGVLIWTADPVGPGVNNGVGNTVGIVGEVRAYAGPASALPSGWGLCDGAAYSRTTYVDLFNVIGTTWGAGNGSTTFNVPDLRGRTMFGLDNMGGSAANRVTAGVSGIPGTTLGGVGGSQLSQLHTHVVTDPTHTHVVTDPGHLHKQQNFNSGTVGGPTNQIPGTGGGAHQDASLDTKTNTTGITIAAATTGITIANAGTGTTENMPPTAMVNWMIYLGA